MFLFFQVCFISISIVIIQICFICAKFLKKKLLKNSFLVGRFGIFIAPKTLDRPTNDVVNLQISTVPLKFAFNNTAQAANSQGSANSYLFENPHFILLHCFQLDRQKQISMIEVGEIDYMYEFLTLRRAVSSVELKLFQNKSLNFARICVYLTQYLLELPT